jgi:nickel-dependent lactate racemase
MTDAADELLCGIGGESTVLGAQELREAVKVALDKLGPKEKVLIIPPDFTRAHSQAGIITKLVYEYYGDKVKDILPALGSHVRNPSIALQNMPRSANHGLAHRTR